MADPIPLACPFDGFATPTLEPGSDQANDGTETWRVICPVCDMNTGDMPSKAAACAKWNARFP